MGRAKLSDAQRIGYVIYYKLKSCKTAALHRQCGSCGRSSTKRNAETEILSVPFGFNLLPLYLPEEAEGATRIFRARSPNMVRV